MNHKNFDIIIVGAGHAGIEAAYIASQFNLNIALITLPNVPIASTPCNPSIGGVGKGQVVRELDALGGLAPKLADLSGIQYRILNESKGDAVKSTRIQVDKIKYAENAEIEILKVPNIHLIKEKVLNIHYLDSALYEVRTTESVYHSTSLIVTVGTFLNGKLHTGEVMGEGGRIDAEASNEMSNFLHEIKTLSMRFKTGTPPRLDKNTIDFSKFEVQPSDPSVMNFHCLHDPYNRFLPQVDCYLGRSNKETLTIIRNNKERSPIFNGQIKGVGPRYCPSIEDKAYRYPDRHEHHLFLEPESHDLDTIYPNGISTSLPIEVQEEFVHTIEGLENAKILVPGYAVEYDVIDTTKLSLTLEYEGFPHLYFAGQINGTSGYEEASGQGYIAGVNSALKILKHDPLILKRDSSYIGVMIEDLIFNLRDEPYRLFTARAENRLHLREDNSIIRLYDSRKQLNLFTPVDRFNEDFHSNFNILTSVIDNIYLSPDDNFVKTYPGLSLTKRSSLSEIIKQSSVDSFLILKNLLSFYGFIATDKLILAVSATNKYKGYIKRAEVQYKRVHKLDQMKIRWNDITASKNISFECKTRIERVKPETFGQLKAIEGIRPATLAIVASKAY